MREVRVGPRAPLLGLLHQHSCQQIRILDGKLVADSSKENNIGGPSLPYSWVCSELFGTANSLSF